MMIITPDHIMSQLQLLVSTESCVTETGADQQQSAEESRALQNGQGFSEQFT